MKSKLPKYGVRFIGYSARVVARRNGRDVDYAQLDLVSGVRSIHAYGGWIMAHEIGLFVNNLPQIAAELEELLRELESSLSGKASRGPYSATRLPEARKITISPDGEIKIPETVDVRRFVRKVVKRFGEVERVLEQATVISNTISRRPYSEYIEEIGKTGICRVEYYGDAFFVDGKLRFYPERRTTLVRPQSDTTNLVQELEDDRPSLN
jgi:hypothetical protein